MEFMVVRSMQSMPICFVQGTAISQTICAIFTGQEPSEREVRRELHRTIAISNGLRVRDLVAENKYRGQPGQTIAICFVYKHVCITCIYYLHARGIDTISSYTLLFKFAGRE